MSLKDPNAVTVSSSCSRRSDALVEGYATWREESAAVTVAYENWARASRGERVNAYAAYVTALNSEERAASDYQRLVEQPVA
ncbi:MAG TPA: hypothetical protein VGF70_02975 [Solirubrobacteraceae bacterium]|jgi:hypothetical protein